MRVFIASSNRGKLRDFAAAALSYGIEMDLLPGISEISAPEEDGHTFEENARKKSEYYSRFASGSLVIADDSGLEVDALGGAPGVYSARYAAEELTDEIEIDAANNSKLLRELAGVPDDLRGGRFVCVISAARDGREVASFRGSAEGMILHAERGSQGFGYDPLFFFPQWGKAFAELNPTEKAEVSHRGAAFRKFLEWCNTVGR